MRTTLTLIILIALVFVVCGASFGVANAKGGLIPPPAINIPYGAKIVTEVNLSDGDVLGILKQLVPVMGDAVDSLASAGVHAGPVDPRGKVPLEALKSLDFKGLAEAVAGIKNVRFLIAKYDGCTNNTRFLAQLDAGAAKAGKFSKIASDIAFGPGAFALYAEPNNAGYMGFAYDANGGVLYAFRVVGFVDVPKLAQWFSNAAKTFMSSPAKMPDQPPVAPGTPIPAPSGSD